jgi:hypothetical protein
MMETRAAGTPGIIMGLGAGTIIMAITGMTMEETGAGIQGMTAARIREATQGEMVVGMVGEEMGAATSRWGGGLGARSVPCE